MALQDLTPQLRTRLSRMERAVGLFVLIAASLLVFGFVYYVYNTARNKGWFLTKVKYFTFTDRATGLKEGDPVTLMGFPAGHIKKIESQPADDFTYNVYIEFELKSPYYDYMWTEGSRAKITSADFLGKRVIEVTKGTGGYPSHVFFPLRTNVPLAEVGKLTPATNWVSGQEIYDRNGSNLLLGAQWDLTNLAALAAAGYSNLTVLDRSTKERRPTGIWNRKLAQYEPMTSETKPYWLLSDESAAVTERLEGLVGAVERALPNILALTNRLAEVLLNSSSLTSNLNQAALSARPALSNIAAATANLDHPGALGEWVLPTNINHQLEATLTGANATLETTSTNLAALAANLERSLNNVANLTSNLNQQVEVNSNVLSKISQVIVNADDLVEGLKHHWLLRSAFKKKSSPAARPPRNRAPEHVTPRSPGPAALPPRENLRAPKEKDAN